MPRQASSSISQKLIVDLPLGKAEGFAGMLCPFFPAFWDGENQASLNDQCLFLQAVPYRLGIADGCLTFSRLRMMMPASFSKRATLHIVMTAIFQYRTGCRVCRILLAVQHQRQLISMVDLKDRAVEEFVIVVQGKPMRVLS